MKQKTGIGIGMIIGGITGIVFGTIAGGTLLGTFGAISEANYPSPEEALVHPFGFLLTVGIFLGFWTGVIGGIIGALIGISASEKFLFGAVSGGAVGGVFLTIVIIAIPFFSALVSKL